MPSDGETDTSITGWMIFALKAGADAGLKIDREGFASALAWIDSVTDTKTGRVGYLGPERGGRFFAHPRGTKTLTRRCPKR